jgi:2-polyprenyl-3-methyl-5-hydroxy-6-metoxy-1,4-benzoquinol methylase
MNVAASEIRCPVCGGAAVHEYCREHGWRAAREVVFEFCECDGCGSVFLSSATPPPPDIYSAKYYDSDAQTPSGWNNIAGRLNHQLRLQRAPRLAVGSRVLDVGCGGGEWLMFLQEHGCEVSGLDPSEEACAAARRRGLARIHRGSLVENDLPENHFDLVTGIHCLEHAPSPSEFVRGAARLVREGGWLGVSIPNVASWEARRARGRWYHLDPPYHLCLPTPNTMRAVFAAASLSNLRVKCPVLEYCQSLFYAWRREPTASPVVTLMAMPLILLQNSILALRGQTGVIEFWGQKPGR